MKGDVMTIMVILAAIIGGMVSIHFLGDDNPVEQIAEVVIFEETGKQIDLSPTKGEPK